MRGVVVSRQRPGKGHLAGRRPPGAARGGRGTEPRRPAAARPHRAAAFGCAARTPIGAFNGGLAGLPAHKLGEVAIAEVLRRAQVEPGEVSEVILGQILAAGEGMNPARQAAIAAGIPYETTAYSVNQVCG